MALPLSLVCAAVLLLLFCAPIDVRVEVERDEVLRTHVRLAWMFGLIRFRIRQNAEPKSTAGRSPRRSGKLGTRIAAGLLRPEFRARTIAFLRDVLRAIRPRDVRVRARIGLGDPADTGRLWGLLGPLGALLSHTDVRFNPAFDEACLRIQAAARVRLIPGQLAFLTTAFLVSPPTVRALFAR